MAEINSILFVCMGNICRSPSAEAVFRQKVSALRLALEIDSAGTIGAHAREKPDARSVKAGEARGYDFAGIRSRKVKPLDFEQFDLILAMDKQNFSDLLAICPEQYQPKVKLMLSYAKNHQELEVPDPYYGGAKGFDFVLDLIEDACDGLLAEISLSQQSTAV